MNIFLRELRAHWKGLLGWSVGMAFTIASGMAKFEGYSAAPGGKSPVTQLLASFPKPVLAIFGITGLDLTTLIGYFGVLYLYILLVASIHAGLLGSEIVSKEERDKTSEFLYPKPVSRTRILTEKLLAGVLNLGVMFVVTVLTSLWMVAYYNKGNSLDGKVWTMMAGVAICQLLFFSFGIMISGMFKNPKASGGLVATVLFATYLMSVLVDINSKLDFLKYLTPFRFFSAPKILADGTVDPVYVVVSLLLVVAFIALGYVFYNKRDLTV